MNKSKKHQLSLSCGTLQKDGIKRYFGKNMSKKIVTIALKAIADNKTEVISIPSIGKSVSFLVSCSESELTMINNFVDKHNLNKSRWLVGLIHEAILK